MFQISDLEHGFKIVPKGHRSVSLRSGPVGTRPYVPVP